MPRIAYSGDTQRRDDMTDADRQPDDYDVWSAAPCDHDYSVSWGFPCVTYTCIKCGDEYEKDVS